MLRLHIARIFVGDIQLCQMESMPLLPRQSMAGGNRLSMMSSKPLQQRSNQQCCVADWKLLTVQSLGVQGPPESVRIAALTAKM